MLFQSRRTVSKSIPFMRLVESASFDLVSILGTVVKEHCQARSTWPPLCMQDTQANVPPQWQCNKAPTRDGKLSLLLPVVALP